VTTVLLFDTNISSSPIYRYLAGEGFDVHVVGRNPQDFLAKTAKNYVDLDYSDVRAAVALVERLGATYIVPGCNDLSYSVCSQITATRSFPGIDPVSVSRTLMNKQEFRQYAASNGLPAPRALVAGDAVGRPVIVKPVDAYSGRGVTALKAPSQAELAAAVALAQQFSQSGGHIIEEYVEGQLYSHTAFLGPSGVVADFIVEEYGSVSPFTVDTSRVVHDFPLLSEVRAAINQVALGLNLQSGLIHTQFITDTRNFWIVEVTRRCPGDLYSLLISLSTGFNYVENYVRPFIGRPFRDEPQSARPIMRHTVALPQDQNFEAIRFSRPLTIEMFAPLAVAGDRVKGSPFGRIGLLFARAQSERDLDDLMRATLAGELYTVVD